MYYLANIIQAFKIKMLKNGEFKEEIFLSNKAFFERKKRHKKVKQIAQLSKVNSTYLLPSIFRNNKKVLHHFCEKEKDEGRK